MQLPTFLRALLVLFLCATALRAAAQINPGFDPSTPIRVVYRIDLAQPLGAFIAGFNARGVNEDLLALTSGAACNHMDTLPGAGWVAMTASREQAVRFAQRALERLSPGASNRRVYLYSVRANREFISVPGAFYSAIDAGRAARAGYAPEHANALEYLLYTRPILGEQMVVTPQVNGRNIIDATSLWMENGDLVESGEPIVNDTYFHDPSTAATNVVPDARLPSLLAPWAILSSEAGASGTCAMSCDRATSASSFSIGDALDHAAVCSQSDAISPLLLDIIND